NRDFARVILIDQMNICFVGQITDAGAREVKAGGRKLIKKVCVAELLAHKGSYLFGCFAPTSNRGVLYHLFVMVIQSGGINCLRRATIQTEVDDSHANREQQSSGDWQRVNRPPEKKSSPRPGFENLIQ